MYCANVSTRSWRRPKCVRNGSSTNGVFRDKTYFQVGLVRVTCKDIHTFLVLNQNGYLSNQRDCWTQMTPILFCDHVVVRCGSPFFLRPKKITFKKMFCVAHIHIYIYYLYIYTLRFQPPLKRWVDLYNHHCLPKKINHRNWVNHYFDGGGSPGYIYIL